MTHDDTRHNAAPSGPIGPAVLRFGRDLWDPARHVFSDLKHLATSTFEAEELDRMKDLVIHGRIWRRQRGGGEAQLQVEKDIIGGIVKAINKDTREVEVVASTDEVDRYKDTIQAKGWILKEYRRNPVILIDHDYTIASIVGQSPKQTIGDHDLRMVHRFDPEGTNAAADMLVPKIINRSARANSVGFLPVKWAMIRDEEDNWTGGFDFQKHHLLEDSWVAVGANPSALALDTPDPSTAAIDEVLDPDKAAPQGETLSGLESIQRRTHRAAIAVRIGGIK
jgi:hypothetical protein